MVKAKEQQKSNKYNKKSSKRDFIFAVGRRREAVARVRLYSTGSFELNGTEYKKGDIIINDRPFAQYFRFQGYSPLFKEFMNTTQNALNDFVVSIKVRGGGLRGQIDAVLHGAARALDKADKEKFHSSLKTNGYLTRDPRERERRKVGTGGKARRQKQSPKR